MLKKVMVGCADEMTEKSAKFMQIIKEMESKADADQTKMQELQNKVDDLMKYDSRFNYRSREDGLLIDRLNNEKAEQEILRARIIATNRKCPKCAERIAAFEVSIAACQQKLESERSQHVKEYEYLLEQNGELKYFLERNDEDYNALKQKYEN